VELDCVNSKIGYILDFYTNPEFLDEPI